MGNMIFFIFFSFFDNSPFTALMPSACLSMIIFMSLSTRICLTTNYSQEEVLNIALPAKSRKFFSTLREILWVIGLCLWLQLAWITGFASFSSLLTHVLFLLALHMGCIPTICDYYRLFEPKLSHWHLNAHIFKRYFGWVLLI